MEQNQNAYTQFAQLEILSRVLLLLYENKSFITLIFIIRNNALHILYLSIKFKYHDFQSFTLRYFGSVRKQNFTVVLNKESFEVQLFNLWCHNHYWLRHLVTMSFIHLIGVSRIYRLHKIFENII